MNEYRISISLNNQSEIIGYLKNDYKLIEFKDSIFRELGDYKYMELKQLNGSYVAVKESNIESITISEVL